MKVILEGKGLTKWYQMGEVRVNALRGVDFEIFEGEFVVVLGPSGSGKSTMLNIIGGMDKPSSGELFYLNEPIHSAKESKLTQYRRHAIGFVFQLYNLMPNLTVLENVQVAAEIVRDPLDAVSVLREVGLADRTGHFPSQLSGGEQQRVAIARSIVKNPQILLCDEPTGALDFSTGIQVLKLLKDFQQKYKKTVIIITHNAGIAQTADRVFKVKDGKLASVYSVENPVDPEEVSW